MRSAPVLLTLLSIPLAACTVGEVVGPGGGDDTIGGDDDDIAGGPDAAAPDPDYLISMSPATATTSLGTTTAYTVTVDVTDFGGPVNLAVTGVPASWTATLEPATVNVTEDGSATAQLIVTIPTNAESTTASLGVVAQASPGERTSAVQLSVLNELFLAIPAGSANGGHQFPDTLQLRRGARLTIRNDDTTLHRIHSDGGGGFPHQDNDMAQGDSYSVVPTDAGNYRFYCHTHGEGTGDTTLAVQ